MQLQTRVAHNLRDYATGAPYRLDHRFKNSGIKKAMIYYSITPVLQSGMS